MKTIIIILAVLLAIFAAVMFAVLALAISTVNAIMKIFEE